MTELDPIDLSEATTAVAVSNTPTFLARRLREDPALKRALDLHGPEKIFGALEKISARKPADLDELTEVYFYLVAVSLASDALLRLHRTRGLPTSPHVKWFRNIADYLISIAEPTSITSVGNKQVGTGLIINPDQPRHPTANTATSKIIRI